LALPNPDFLDCHYRLAEILNASGMAESIEQHFQDWDDIKARSSEGLREDGATDIARILEAGLWERVIG